MTLDFDRVAKSDLPVLLSGESGSGKTRFAKELHEAGRSGRKFVSVNCGALPEALFESELFGHEKGAFTGASGANIGLCQTVANGTLFLDEVGDMPLSIQVKLLSLLQDRQFRRIGGKETMKFEARVIAATNHNLKQLVAERRFRADLYYRLAVLPIAVPPLREQPDLLWQLVKLAPYTWTRDAAVLLGRYSWPGNVRQFNSVMGRLGLLTDGTVTAQDLERAINLEDLC